MNAMRPGEPKTRLSVFSAFKPWPIRYLEHDWDDIVAEHGVVTFTTGSSTHRQHTLALMVRDKTAGDFKGPITPDNTPPYVDGFALGDPKTLSEVTVPPSSTPNAVSG
jgi:hypothetical protein